MTLRGQRRARRQQEESRLKRFETGWWGAWRLAEFSRSAEDGTVTYPMGEDVEGLIIYTPDGYMSAQLMKLERPAYASGDFTHGTTEEEAAAAAGYLAYSGPFFVDEEAGTLRHQMSVSLFPNWLNDTQERFVELEGDTLTISAPPILFEGSKRTPRLIWKRATPNPPATSSGSEGDRGAASNDPALLRGPRE